MLKKTIKYVDYDGKERIEDFYFNLNKVEVSEMELSSSGGVTKTIERMVAEEDGEKLLKLVKDFILKAYGVKSTDGKFFNKSPELSEGFSHTEAYVELFMELSSNAEAAYKFVNGVLPQVPQPIPQN